MPETAIADFVGKFSAESTDSDEPVPGRILLSQKRLVLVADDVTRITIPLSAVVDVGVGQIPQGVSEYFDAGLSIAYRRNGPTKVAVIEADDEKIGKFSRLLFTAILSGTDMTIKHPATVGGRVTDQPFEPAQLSLHASSVRFTTADRRVEIALSAVTDFDRRTREFGEASRPVLQVRHMADHTAVTTIATARSKRKMSILGRYLRQEYTELMDAVAALDLESEAKAVLVAVYAGAAEQPGALPSLLDMEPDEVSHALERLGDADLLANGDGRLNLTPTGQAYVSNHHEDLDI